MLLWTTEEHTTVMYVRRKQRSQWLFLTPPQKGRSENTGFYALSIEECSCQKNIFGTR